MRTLDRALLAACACDASPNTAGATADAIDAPTERTAASINAEYRALDARPGALRVVDRARDPLPLPLSRAAAVISPTTRTCARR